RRPRGKSRSTKPTAKVSARWRVSTFALAAALVVVSCARTNDLPDTYAWVSGAESHADETTPVVATDTPTDTNAWADECWPEVHCKHFFYGRPRGTPYTNDLIIRDGYAMSSNDDTKLADWVAYRLESWMFE